MGDGQGWLFVILILVLKSVKEKPYSCGDIWAETSRKWGECHAVIWVKLEEQHEYL